MTTEAQRAREQVIGYLTACIEEARLSGDGTAKAGIHALKACVELLSRTAPEPIAISKSQQRRLEVQTGES